MTGRTSVIGREASKPEMGSPMTSRERVRCALNTRNQAGLSGDPLFFFVEHGDVTFGGIQVRPRLT